MQGYPENMQSLQNSVTEQAGVEWPSHPRGSECLTSALAARGCSAAGLGFALRTELGPATFQPEFLWLCSEIFMVWDQREEVHKECCLPFFSGLNIPKTSQQRTCQGQLSAP